ncbi:MAG: cytochrome c3 family protein [Planctomycetota bacterium]|nr:cytochrome c3 family protein [Planctomycetota bacterium]
MSIPRILVGLLVLATGALALVAVFKPPPAAVASGQFVSSEQCRECHAQTFTEWQSSWHAQSWTDPDVRVLSNDFANTDCIDCHAPVGVFETGIGKRVLPRASRRSEGVDCLSCHLLPQDSPDGGVVAGTLDRDDVPCKPRARRELSSVDHCASCHDQHKTVEQWRASNYAASGITCVTCHMPFRNGDPNQGRDHTMHGGHSIEVVRSAVTLTATRTPKGVAVTVENVGAGHHFPTDERSRAADIFWRPVDAAGIGVGSWRFLYRFRSPYRHEVDLFDTLLPAHAKHESVIEAVEANTAIEVALFYKLTPYWKNMAEPDPDNEARLVHRVVVAP